VMRYLCISFTMRSVRWTTGERESKEEESSVATHPLIEERYSRNPESRCWM
jgi:hypothetical protein